MRSRCPFWGSRLGSGSAPSVAGLFAESALIALVYMLVGRLSLSVALPQSNLAGVWLPAGLSTALVLLRGRCPLPGIALGGLLTALSVGAPLSFAGFAALGAALQAGLAAGFLERWGFDLRLGRLADVVAFLALAVIGAPATDAALGAFGLCAAAIAPWGDFARLAAQRWLADAAAVLLVAPLVLSAVCPRLHRPLGSGWEASAMFAVLTVVSLAIYGGTATPVNGLPLAYLCFPLVLWAATRFGARETTVALVIVALAAAMGLADGRGMFAGRSLQDGVMCLDGFLLVIGAVGLMAAAGGNERRSARAALLAATADLRQQVVLGSTTLAEADARLAECETWFHSLADNIPQLAWIAEPGGTIVWYNRRWYDFTGTTPDEMQRLGWGCVHPDHAEGVVSRLRDALARDEAWEDTFPLRGATGEYRWFLSRARPVHGPDGAIGLWFGTHTDITGQREAEARLQAAKAEAEAAREDAERAHAAKSTFLASASHDLRQPVQSLMLFHNLLETKLSGHPARPVVDHLAKATEVLQQLLDGLLDVSRLDAGVIDVKPERFDLDAMLRRLAGEYRPRAAEKALGLRLVAGRATVDLDPALLERVLRNLLDNALRYTPRGGVVFGCRRGRGGLRIEVVDSGVGIAAEHLENIFDEFFQVGNPARDRAQGLGLGLSVAKRVADLMGWSLTVTSAEGKGSRFSLTIPACQVVEVGGAAGRGGAAVARRDRARPLAAVIDDEPMLRTGLRLLLERWGFEVIDAASGAQTVDRLQSAGRVPDLVIADYRLDHGETGVEAIGLIAARIGRPRHTYILTGDMAPERIAEARLAGHHLLHKPVTPEVLQTALAPALCAA